MYGLKILNTNKWLILYFMYSIKKNLLNLLFKYIIKYIYISVAEDVLLQLFSINIKPIKKKNIF